MKIDIILKKEDVKPGQLAGKDVVVLDALRATSTITNAFQNGCREIIPVTKPTDAFMLKKQLGKLARLGGERDKKRIPGFDFGNSPREYTQNRMQDKVLIFTTTNGTDLINRCSEAKEIIIGSFLNGKAVGDYLENRDDVVLACAGMKGQFSLEDYLLAGYLVGKLYKKHPQTHLNKECLEALELYQKFKSKLPEILLTTGHGQGLASLGLEKDIAYCTQHNLSQLVPKVKTRAYFPRIQC